MEFGCVINIYTVLLLSLVIPCESGEIKINDHSNDFSEILLNSIEMIQKHNYLAEKHLVITEDGYMLNLFRIRKQGPPVLLVHGIGDSSDSWLVLGPSSSLAYRLADTGYDVWLFNSRGNRYSKKHSKKISDKEYWNFSFEEMGTKDLSATIDYILSTTSVSKVSYVGFSQGTTIFFVLCSMRPSYNSKINQAILLAPVAIINNIQSPLLPLYARFYKKLISLAGAGINEVFPFTTTISIYHALVCNVNSPFRFFCELEYNLNFGLERLEKFFVSRLPIIASHIPAGASLKTFLHYLQSYVFKSFRRYDYGTRRNIDIYNSSNPPVYDLSLIDAPITLMISDRDWFSTLEDVKILQGNLRNIIRTVVINKTLDFTHLEFVYGQRVNPLVNNPIISFLQDQV